MKTSPSNSNPNFKRSTGLANLEMIIALAIAICGAFVVVVLPTIKYFVALRNAQNIVCVLNAAQMAGANLSEAGVKDPATAVQAAVQGVIAPPTDDNSEGKTYSLGSLGVSTINPAADAAALISVLPGDDGKLLISVVTRPQQEP